MRIPATIALTTLLIAGCTDPADPADPGEVLRDFAETMADEVYDAIWAGIAEEEGIELWVPESDALLSGDLDLPTSSGATYGVDGELSFGWTLLFFESEYPMDGEYNWTWNFAGDIQRLQLPDCELRGQGSWMVQSVYYDNANHSHGFDGFLAIDGGEPLDVGYSAHFSGNLHWVRGHIGDVEVDWENPNPDLP
jgi:hypothetical protein